VTTRRPDPPSNPIHDDDAPPASGLSSMQRAILTIQKMRAKIESLERARVEPIAIIGIGCRFPGGANNPEAFFQLLEDGVDAIREVPPERWPLEAEGPDTEGEERALRWGSFLDDVDKFDASFFGISPREAESLDPQQRLLLEVSWEALERAGQLPERLMGSRTGVFVGIWALDYQQRVLAQGEDKLDAYCFTGNVLSTAAGRLAYTIGLQGPCISVETACSSSLTAIHLACQSLRNGESSLALAGGVNLMLSPATTKLLSKTQALSPDGRCKSFDSRANGFVRGEGCGMVVLKRLSDAERDGDAIIALIRGSAVNQDGRSTGLTAPNVLSQQALLRQALENARVAPSDVGYVEAHGTGTSLGDPIEVEALKAVLGGPREKGSTCVLGALKTNIGHLEAAAGVAGLIKVALALQNERIPGNLHFRALNPRIDLRGTSLEIAKEPVPWKPGLRPRFAGVSSFGISGTNAHIVLEEAPRNLEEPLGEAEAGVYLLPLSAKTPEALQDLARAYHGFLAAGDAPRLVDIAHTASARRSHYEHRLSIVGATREEMAGALDAFLRGEAPPGVVQGKATPARAKVVFVFSGQGSQWLGMGQKLYEAESAFRSVIDSCDALMTPRLGWSILDELGATENVSRVAETQVAQPMIFAIQIALVELLRSWGISPDAVIGHSVGEIAAAHIAGILSLDEAVRLVAIRGRIMQKATGQGKMASVALPPEAAKKAIAGYEARLSIAAVNDPGSVVLAGDTQAMDEVVAKLEKEGISCRALRVNYAFHSPQMEPLAAELVERLVRVNARRATLAMYSTVLSECVEGAELDVRYWGRNVRDTVNLAGAVGEAIRDGYQLFLEVGPHPVVAENVRQTLAAKKADGFVAYTMRRNQDERRSLLDAAGSLYTRGCFPEWSRLVPGGGRVVPLPTYPWQRERFWVEVQNLRWGAASRQADTTESRTDPLDECVHVVEWRRAEPGAACAVKTPGTWLIFADTAGVASSLARLLEARGESFVRVVAGDRYERTEPGLYCIDPSDPASYRALLRDAFGKGTACRGVVHLFGLDATPWESTTAETLDADQRLGSLSAAFLVQAIVRHSWRDKPSLWMVTRGAQCVGTQPGGASVAQAPLWGLARTVELEHPEIACMLVDLLGESPDAEGAMLLRELDAADGEHVASRSDGRYVARLVRSSFDAAPTRPTHLHADAVYLITGGLSGLGLNIAQWMVSQGVRHLALAARSEPSEAVRSAIRAMEDAGASVLVLRGDVARADDVAAMIAEIDRQGLPLRGIVHAAGIVGEKALLRDLEAQQFLPVLAPKVRGAWNLHKLSLGRPLDFFVVYSSASAVLGLVGQAAYASANAFLDALAAARVGNGLPAMSIQWGPFADVGIAARDGRGARMSGAGLGVLAVADGPHAFGRLLERPRATVGIFRFDSQQWFDIFPHAAASAFWSELPKKAPRGGAADSRAQDIKNALANAGVDARRALMEQFVREQLGQVFRMAPDRIDVQAPFSSMGVDSLMSLKSENLLERSLGLRLPATLLFTYPTTASLVGHLLVEIAAEVGAEPAAVSDAAQPEKNENDATTLAADDDLLADFEATMQLVKGKKA